MPTVCSSPKSTSAIGQRPPSLNTRIQGITIARNGGGAAAEPGSVGVNARHACCGATPSEAEVADARAASAVRREHTQEILADVLGLPPTEIGRLHDDGVVASAAAARAPTAVPR
jgi:hypothetical protein